MEADERKRNIKDAIRPGTVFQKSENFSRWQACSEQNISNGKFTELPEKLGMELYGSVEPFRVVLHAR